jgi:general secretion pathway protein D
LNHSYCFRTRLMQGQFFFLPALIFILILAGCGTSPVKQSRQLFEEGQIDEAVLLLEKALAKDPDDRKLRSAYFRQREVATSQLLARAESEREALKPEAAEATYRRLLRFDAANQRALNGIEEINTARRHTALMSEASVLFDTGNFALAERIVNAILAENTTHTGAYRLLMQLREKTARIEEVPPQILKGPFSRPITLEFRDAPLKTVFEVIARSSDINFVFDKDVKPDTRVTVFVRNTNIDDAIRLILTTNQLASKMLNDNSVLIYPNTAAKTKDHQELVVKSIYLTNTDVKQAQALLRSVTKTRDVFADERLNLIIIKDTPEAVRLAEKLLASLDLAEPEVMLDVEVLEIASNKLRELGLRFPDQLGYGLLQPARTTTTVINNIAQTSAIPGGTLAAGFVELFKPGVLRAFTINPAILLNLKNEDGASRLLANPRIRVLNREKAKIHIGEKLPVFTTTSAVNVGVAASVNYLDVGLKLDVEPNVYLNNEVLMKVGLEVSSVVKEISGPGNSLAYQVGTRNATTSLRLKDGETQILAGLINNEERTSGNRLPGLGDVPVLGRLFSSQKDSTIKTEIVLLITPRITRSLVRPESHALTHAFGTESAIGMAPVTLKPAQWQSAASALSPASPTPSPVMAPPPAAPGATGAPVPAEAGPAQLQLSGPGQLQSGKEGVMMLELSAQGTREAEVEILYDASRLDVNGGSNGRVTVTLPGSETSGIRSELHFRALSPGSTTLQVSKLRAVDRSGAEIRVSTLPVHTMSISP